MVRKGDSNTQFRAEGTAFVDSEKSIISEQFWAKLNTRSFITF